MTTKLMAAQSAIGVSNVQLSNLPVTTHTVSAYLNSTTTTAISAATIELEGTNRLSKGPVDDYSYTGMTSAAGLAVGSTAEKYANGLMYYRLKGVNYTLAADAVGATFTANHVVTASKFGVIRICVDSAGTLISQVPAATATTAMAYADAPTALAAGNAMILETDRCLCGFILIEADGSTWTANTDDLTAASDLTSVGFMDDVSTFNNLATHAFDADEITAQQAMFHVINKGVKHLRLNLSALTGTGNVDGFLSAE